MSPVNVMSKKYCALVWKIVKRNIIFNLLLASIDSTCKHCVQGTVYDFPVRLARHEKKAVLAHQVYKRLGDASF